MIHTFGGHEVDDEMWADLKAEYARPEYRDDPWDDVDADTPEHDSSRCLRERGLDRLVQPLRLSR